MSKTMSKVALVEEAKSAKPARVKKAKTVSAARSKATVAKRKSSAKPATSGMTKAAKLPDVTAATVKAATANAESVMRYGTQAVRDLFATGGMDSSRAKDQWMTIGKEGAAQIAKTADAASRSLSEMFDVSKGTMDTCVTCGNIAVGATKSIGAELFNYANQSFSQNVEISKELFGCRTLNDMFDLQSKLVKANLDSFFNESVKMSEIAFRAATDVTEPLTDRVSKTADRLTKSWSEAA